MADNVAITAGAGTTIATDEVGGAQYQRVKVTWGADGTANETAAATPLPVDSAAATPTAYNLTLTNANTEYSQALSAHCRGFEFQCLSPNGISSRGHL